MVNDGPSPVVQRRRLRAELRNARQEAGLTQEQVATVMDWSLSKVIRIEAGSANISANDLGALLRHYQIIDPDRTNELMALARMARERSWWSGYREIAPVGLLHLIEYETVASIMRHFEPLLVPGLLQTEEYARAVIKEFQRRAPAGRVDTLVEIRMRRQELLDRTDPPLLFFILDESIVHRLIGGKAVMRRQVHRLIETLSKPNITIEIVPFSAGAHPGLKGSFMALEFPDPSDDDVLYLESARGDLISRDVPEEALAYREIFAQLRTMSLGPEGSAAYLAQMADGMT